MGSRTVDWVPKPFAAHRCRRPSAMRSVKLTGHRSPFMAISSSARARDREDVLDRRSTCFQDIREASTWLNRVCLQTFPRPELEAAAAAGIRRSLQLPRARRFQCDQFVPLQPFDRDHPGSGHACPHDLQRIPACAFPELLLMRVDKIGMSTTTRSARTVSSTTSWSNSRWISHVRFQGPQREQSRNTCSRRRSKD